jgi:hypothetical protein
VDETDRNLSPAASDNNLIYVNASTPWRATVDYGTYYVTGWITLIDSTGTAPGNVKFKVAANTTAYKLEATIKITVGAETYSVKINQNAYAIAVDPLTLSFDSIGGEKTLKLRINASIAGWIAKSYASWLTVTPSSGSYTGRDTSITVRAEANKIYTSLGSRTAIISFKSNVAGSTDTVAVTVTQKAPMAIVLEYTPDSLKTFGAGGDTTLITVVSTVDWKAEVRNQDTTWLSLSPPSPSGSGDGSFIITAKPNSSNTSRSGQVNLYESNNTNRYKAITVPQYSQASGTPDSVVLNAVWIWVKPTEFKPLTATIYPSTVANKQVEWTVDDPDVAEVIRRNDTTCWITGIKAGVTTVRASTEVGKKTAECLVIVNEKEPIANEAVDAAVSHVAVDASGNLTVDTPVAEQISIYTISGALLLQSQKTAGAATFDIRRLPAGVLIVKGESGWRKKIVVR